MKPKLTILYLEDDPNDVKLIETMLKAEHPDSHLIATDNRAEFERMIDESKIDLLLVDYKLPSFDGMTALELCKQKCPDIPFIFVSGVLGEDLAIESLKKGATDYVLKSGLSRLIPSVQRALREAQERRKRKRAEAERENLLRELRRKNVELEDFAHLASHDLQEPLRKVINFSKILKKRYGGQLDQKADEYIEYIVDGAARMQTLIQDLLTYSRIGRMAAVVKPVDLKSVLSDITSDLAIAINESQTTIHYDELPSVEVNPLQIKQVLQNLISNAIKYRSSSPPEIRVTCQTKADRWWFSVSDNGIGIEPRFSEKIFRIFQRLHTPEEYPGTGVGLAICKKIVDQNGGHIWFESAPGEGSTFFFTIRKQTQNDKNDP